MLHLAEDARTDGDGTAPGPRAVASSTEPPPEVAAARADAARRLLERALGLPPEYREPLLLRCVRALSYQQISAILDLPVTTVETRLARARRMLREEIGEQVMNEGFA